MNGLGESKDQRLDNQLPPLVVAAHELKTPLALVRQLALELKSQALSESDRWRVIEQIYLSTQRSLELVTGVTRAARLEDSLFATETVNLSAICEQVAHEMTPLYRAHNKNIEVKKRHSPVMAVANYELLGRIVRQFADNALHYSDEASPVILSSSSSQDRVRISVRDYGPALPGGIRMADGWQPTSSRPESSGIGLQISNQFAEAMNGQIGITRHRDGASFYVDLTKSRQLALV